MTSTISIKDYQRCFQKERQALLCDIESLRQQLIKKEKMYQKAEQIASTSCIQLKKEITHLQSSLQTSQVNSTKWHDQYNHQTMLLESALSQHQEDLKKINQLAQELRTIHKKHDSEKQLITADATRNIATSNNERKTLRAQVEHLRIKLESERQQWQKIRTSIDQDNNKLKIKVKVLKKEITESQYREEASCKLKNKMGQDVSILNRKIDSLALALEDALKSKSVMKGEHEKILRRIHEKVLLMSRNHGFTHNQLLMALEDNDSLYRSRDNVLAKHRQCVNDMFDLRNRYEQSLKRKDEELWQLEKHCKKVKLTCHICQMTATERQMDTERKLKVLREQNLLELRKEIELERWEKLQTLQTEYDKVSQHFQATKAEMGVLQADLKRLEAINCQKEDKITQISNHLQNHEGKISELEKKLAEESLLVADGKQTINELMENLSKISTVSANQTKQLQENETMYREKINNLNAAIEIIKQEECATIKKNQEVVEELEQTRQAYEAFKSEKAQQLDEIIEAQLSANVLIEEQAHTIDDLLKEKAKAELKSSCSSDRAISKAVKIVDPVIDNKHVHGIMDKLHHQISLLQEDNRKLKWQLHDAAETIHELTIQDEDDSKSTICSKFD